MKKNIKLLLGLTAIVVCSITFISCTDEHSKTLLSKKTDSTFAKDVPSANQVHPIHTAPNKAMSLKELSIFLMNKYASGYSYIFPINLIKKNNTYTLKKSDTSDTFLFTNTIFKETPVSGNVVISLIHSHEQNRYEFIISSFDYNDLVLITKGYITKTGSISKYY